MEKQNNKHISRRGFLKAAAAAGAALAVSPALEKAQAARRMVSGAPQNEAENTGTLPHRTLGTGKAAFEVSALGFGVMGMTYNRSQHPDKNSASACCTRPWPGALPYSTRPSSTAR